MSAPRPPRAGTVRTTNLALKVVGMKDLRKLLRDLDAGLPGALRDTNKRVVEDIFLPPLRTAAWAHQPKNARQGYAGTSKLHWSDLVRSLRPVSSQTSSGVMFGSTAKSKAWMVGYEFGSIRYKQFPPASPRLGSGSQGYFFYPTIRREVPRVIDAYAESLNRFLARQVNANHTEG